MTKSSARRFPANPPDEELRENYDAMRSALISVNISRGIYRSQSDKRGVVIAELQRELQELEADLGNEARAKARLHAMNSRLVTVIRELEATGDAIAETVEESEQQRRVEQEAEYPGPFRCTEQAVEQNNLSKKSVADAGFGQRCRCNCNLQWCRDTFVLQYLVGDASY